MAARHGAMAHGRSDLVKILITGHNGYIGSVLTPMLITAGHEVSGFDSYWFEHCCLHPFREDFDITRKDIREIATQDLHGFEAVVHLAALCNDPLGDLNPVCTEDINYRATIRLAGLAKQAGVSRFIQASSCSLYGASSDAMIDERAPFNPVSVYGKMKVVAEQSLAILADERFSPTFLRFSTAFGVSPKLRADLVVNNLVGFATITGEILLKSDGEAWRPLIHVEDIARAIMSVCEAPREVVHDQAFNVGRTDENYRVKDIAKLVAANITGSRVRFADKRFRDARNYRVKCEKINELVPGYRPQWNLERGIIELADAFRRYDVDYTGFVGARLDRLQQLKALIQRGELDGELRRTDAHRLVFNE